MNTENTIGKNTVPTPITDEENSTRERLLYHATLIFAEKGFSGSSTREICDAAKTNLSSIRYHFGDKAGLYREILAQPIEQVAHGIQHIMPEKNRFEQTMLKFYRDLFSVLLRPESIPVMRIYHREISEPSGIIEDIAQKVIEPAHRSLENLICHELSLTQADESIQRMVWILVNMCEKFVMCCPMIDIISPGILATPEQIESACKQLTAYACCILAYEKRKRNEST